MRPLRLVGLGHEPFTLGTLSSNLAGVIEALTRIYEKFKLLPILFNIGFKSRADGDLPVQIWGGSLGVNNSM